MKNLTINTEPELKKLVKTSRENIVKINDVGFDKLYPIIDVSNQHATYYDIDSQDIKFLIRPFKVTIL